MNSTMWALVCDSFKRIVQVFLGNVETEMAIVRNAALIKPTKDFLESLRCGNFSSSLYVFPPLLLAICCSLRAHERKSYSWSCRTWIKWRTQHGTMLSPNMVNDIVPQLSWLQIYFLHTIFITRHIFLNRYVSVPNLGCFESAPLQLPTLSSIHLLTQVDNPWSILV